MIHRLTKFRACSLLLTLSFLFSLGIVGCTDKDREAGPAPTPTEDTIKYYFQQDTASKVSAEMTSVALAAFDADWNLLDGASLLQSSIADMAVDGDYIVAEASVPEEAAVLAYCFTNGPGDVAEYAEAEIYVIALEDGETVYTMADGDLLGEPVLSLYADAEHQTEQSEFKVGEEIYPDASLATLGGLEVPVAVMEPVDDTIVAYTAATETSAAQYVAKAEGETSFVLCVAGSFFGNSETGATVKAVEPGPEPTPEPDPTPEPTPDAVAAWVLPEGYELKDGLIYDSEGAQVSDPAAINTKLEITSGESNTGLAVETVTAEDGSVTYKELAAEVTASVESETADHFTAEVKDGAVSVSVSEDAETDETAAITFTAEGYEFQNSLEVTVLSAMRHVTVRVQEDDDPSPSPSPSSSPAPRDFTKLIKAVALDAQGQVIEGAQVAEEDMSKYELDAEGCYNLEVDLPAQAKSLVLVFVLHFEEGLPPVPSEKDAVEPLLGLNLTEEETYFISLAEIGNYAFEHKGTFGFFADAELTEATNAFDVGDTIYYSMKLENGLGIKMDLGEPMSLDTSVVDIVDGSLKAVGPGTCFFKVSALGIEGVLPIIPVFVNSPS
ncbi:MAG: hypothetical protein Q4F00_09545 [bacterium]|nr:hypothetical protein [bacterium]